MLRRMTPEQWAKANALFHEALDRPSTDRDDWLRTATGGDGELLSEVRALLAAHERDPEFLEGGLHLAALRGLDGGSAGRQKSGRGRTGAGRSDTGQGQQGQAGAARADTGRADADAESPHAARAGGDAGRLAAHIGDGASLVGRRIGPYDVTRELGRGGMGIVYLAFDTRLAREVAIKALPREQAADPRRRERLRREARAAAALAHPGIATVFALEEVWDEESRRSELYLVTEYVPGETLREELARRGPLSPRDWLETAIALTRAIGAAHAEGVIHRDLKPENVIRAPAPAPALSASAPASTAAGEARRSPPETAGTRDDGTSRPGTRDTDTSGPGASRPLGGVKILDFGLARVLHDAPADRQAAGGGAAGAVSAAGGTGAASEAGTGGAAATFSRSGMMLGTPAYMAPEQVRGEAVDARTDLFALGAMLYELACGQQPFEAPALGLTLHRLLNESPRPLTDITSAFSPRVSDIVLRCLRKEPSARYASAAALLDDLLRLDDPAASASTSGAASVSASRVDHEASAALADVSTESHARPSQLWWWQFHQLAVSAFFAAAIVPVWRAWDAIPAGLARGSLRTALLAAVAGGVSLRLHLWFVSRHDPQGLADQRRRAAVWTMLADWGFTLTMMAGAAGSMGSAPGRAALLLGLTVCHLVVFLMIEPATTRAAFRGR